ncbi:ABC transporter ATP-binding protein [Photobacterium minamisatsumaniensis]|uniref:ABC transporter ATP-binding protein n=1 Tax=Photobacterium minamisatsumaniensis TaxID=2910233 RepID=UPI003D0E80CC
MTNPIVEVIDLSIYSGENCIVERLSLALRTGQPVTILGETGSGKSLLAQAIMGALPGGLHSDGQITLFDKPTISQQELESYWGRKITMLPQEPWLSLDPIMAGEKQYALVKTLVNHESEEQSKKSTKQSFSAFGLGQDGLKVPNQLSGGMAQRLAYLCATAAGGEVLIADEPTKGLDASRKQQIITLLKQHSKKGCLLTITHDIDIARALGGEIIVMRLGKIVERGSCEKLLQQPISEYAKQLIKAQHYTLPNRDRTHQSHALIQCNQLKKYRGGKRLFNQLDITINQGEIVGVVGDSGTGKSTLADMVLGLTTIDSGNILRCHSLSRGKVLKLYQDPPSAFAQSISLGQNVDDLCQLHGLDKEPIADLMRRLHLNPTLLSRKPAQVSGGELQRFAILRALLMEPKLLVADEPTSRLDPITAASTMRLLIEQTQRIGCALLLISHDRTLIRQVCDKVIDIADYSCDVRHPVQAVSSVAVP